MANPGGFTVANLRKQILEKLNNLCGVCLKDTIDTDYMWNFSDPKISLKIPPSYLEGVNICAKCYNSHNGPKMEDLIRETLIDILGFRSSSFENITRVVMPNGTDGLMCRECNNFCPYVDSNQQDGSYICPEH